MVPTPLLDPFDYAAEGDADVRPRRRRALMPTREVYYEDPNRAKITFTGDVVLYVGKHTFNLIWTPGHTPGQIAVHVPEERVVFTGDTVFNDVQTWVMASDVDQWIDALNTISRLDVDRVVPGHGPVTDLKYLQTQKAVLLEWKSRVADGRGQGLVARGDDRARTHARALPRRYRAGIHDGLHPEAQRRHPLGQAQHQSGVEPPNSKGPSRACRSFVSPARISR